MMRFGVDEAGKGPVFGPMVVCAVVAEPTDLPDGIADSKKLTERKRERLASALRENSDVKINAVHVSPNRIDESDNMGDLAVDVFAEALRPQADDEMAGTVDASDTDAERFGRRINERLDNDVDILSEHGADETDAVVGAASIIAKVERDEVIGNLADEFGNIGSGYPSDPRTREFLHNYVEEHGEAPPFARQSWSTVEDALSDANQQPLDDV